MLNPKAIIFDMDGLVLDSETTYLAAWQQAAASLGYPLTSDFLQSLSGLSADSVMSRLQDYGGAAFDVAEFRRLSTRHWQQHVQDYGIPVKSGFFTLLELIKNRQLPYCLATNSQHRDAIHCLKLANLQQVFPLLICRDDVCQGKPAPDIFLAAALRLNTAIADCLILEDSATGIRAAVAAGAPCIYIPSVYPADQQAATDALAVLDDLQQVCGFIQTEQLQNDL
jgi:HAD superfamily hydrolase (TIGR01509 family)